MNTAFLRLIQFVAFSLVLANARAAWAQSPITYQGRLAQLGAPANGTFAFRFQLFDAEANGQVLHVQENLAILVTNGLFRAELNPAETLIGSTPLWLEIAVRPADLPEVPYATLRPRQQFTYVPNAIFARKAEAVSERSVTSRSLADGAVTANKLASGLFGNGLTLQNNSVELAFAEGGLASTVARGDHRHFGQRWEGPVLSGEAGLEVVNNNGAGGSGLYGESTGAGGAGVKGMGFSRGVQGFSVGGFGVAGETTGGTGIYGSNGNSDTAGHAGYFNGRVRVTQSLTADAGLTGTSANGLAISGTTTSGTGIYGSNGNSDTEGHAGYFNGRVRVTQSLRADNGVSSASASGSALFGESVSGNAVHGRSGSAGQAGLFEGSVRVTGPLAAESGVIATTTANTGGALFGLVQGNSSAKAVYGQHDNGTAIYGESNNGLAIYGVSRGLGFAGAFDGTVLINGGVATGDLSVSGSVAVQSSAVPGSAAVRVTHESRGVSADLAGTAGVVARSSSPTTPALEVSGGPIRVRGAGIGTPTAVFTHVVSAGTDRYSLIDHPMLNGRPDAILIVTPDQSGERQISSGAKDVYYWRTSNQWSIHNCNDSFLNLGERINVLFFLP